MLELLFLAAAWIGFTTYDADETALTSGCCMPVWFHLALPTCCNAEQMSHLSNPVVTAFPHQHETNALDDVWKPQSALL